MERDNSRAPEFWINPDPKPNGTQPCQWMPSFDEIEDRIPLLPSNFSLQNLKTYIFHLRKLHEHIISPLRYYIAYERRADLGSSFQCPNKLWPAAVANKTSNPACI
jgi:hypothetical protein